MGCSNSADELALNAVLQSVRDAIWNGGRVVLTGFGRFERAKRSGRWPGSTEGRGRNRDYVLGIQGIGDTSVLVTEFVKAAHFILESQ